MISKIITFLTYVLVARFLLPEKFGELVFILTLLQIITVIADFGLNQWYQKQADHEDKNELFSKIFAARAITFFGSIVISSMVFFFFHIIKTEYMTWFLAALFPEAIVSISDGYYLEKKQNLRVAFKNASKIGTLLIGFFICRSFFSVQIALFLYILGSYLTALWSFPYRNIFTNPSPDMITHTLKKSASYAMLNLTSYAYARGDSIIIGLLRGNAALGLYGSAYRFLESVSLLPTALSHNLFPISAKAQGVTREQLNKIWIITAFTGAIIGMLFYVFSDLLITGLIGEAYRGAVPIMRLFSIVVFLFFINSPLNTVVISSDEVTKFTPYGIANTVLNLILNIILIPIYGIMGAAIAMLITEITGLVINMYFVKKIYR